MNGYTRDDNNDHGGDDETNLSINISRDSIKRRSETIPDSSTLLGGKLVTNNGYMNGGHDHKDDDDDDKNIKNNNNMTIPKEQKSIHNYGEQQSNESSENSGEQQQPGGSGSGESGESGESGSPGESNNSYEDEGDSDEMTEGSFPTNKDLASFSVNSANRPPETVSYHGSASMCGFERFPSGSFGGSENLSGTMSESRAGVTSGLTAAFGGRVEGVEMSGNASLGVSQRSLSFSSDNDRPDSGGVMIVPSYAASETAKSDIATVCSNSVVEDIDIASVGTAHSASNSHTAGTPSTSTMNQTVQNTNESSAMGKKKSDVSTTIWKYRRGGSYFQSMANSMKTGSSPIQSSIPGPHHSGNLATLNDMGPPLNRSLLERVGGGSGAGSTGTPSRAGSVKSFGSQAASDVVHVDTDDCGGSIAVDSDGHFSGVDENPSENPSRTSMKNNVSDTSSVTMHDMSTNDYITNDETNTQSNVLSLDKLSESYPNGRVSPGGTVYKGRGVRKYQGRYMHLPLKRFQQNGAVLPEPVNLDQDPLQNHYKEIDDHTRDSRRSWKRERSRSRERDIDDNNKWSRSKSPQPPPRQMNRMGHDRNHRGNGRGGNGRLNNGGRWKHCRKNENSNQRYKHNSYNNNTSRRGKRNGGSFHMTPRDPRHRDLK